MDNKQKILHYLSQQKHWVKAKDLAVHFSVSERQIRKYIASINQDAPLILSSIKGYQVDKNEYSQYLSNQDGPLTEQENRRRYILQKLLMHTEGYDLFDFADELFVSEATIKKDIHAIRPLIHRYRLNLIRSKSILRLIGNEEAMRKLMYSFISDYSFHDLFLQDCFHLFQSADDFHSIQGEMKKILEGYALTCNDFALNNLTIHLMIILDRVENGCMLEDSSGNSELNDSVSYQAALSFKNYVQKEFDICLNRSELINLSFIIDNNTNRSGNINYDYLNMYNIHNYVEQKYIDITKDIIQKVEENYFLFPFKENFISKFTLHIQNLFFRSQHHFSAKNPLTDIIKTTYPLIYDMAVFIAQELEQKYDVCLNEDEIAFISFHIGSYFEDNSFSKMTMVNCAFVYTDYYDFYKSALNKIIQKFEDKIAITNVMPVSACHDRLNQDIDLLILPIGGYVSCKIKSVSIKPFLDEQDLNQLEKAVDEISFLKQREELKGYILNFFSEPLFYKKTIPQKKSDLLKEMTDDLYQLGYTKQGFYDDVNNREALSSTSFHDVAVPHALTSKYIHKSFISIALFKDGIVWAENKIVHVVMMIGINDHSRRIFSKFFDQIIYMFDNPANIEKLLHAEHFDDFFIIINEIFQSEQ